MMTIDGFDYEKRWSILVDVLYLMDYYPQCWKRILRFVLDELDMSEWEVMEDMWEAWLKVFNEEQEEIEREKFRRLMGDE